MQKQYADIEPTHEAGKHRESMATRLVSLLTDEKAFFCALDVYFVVTFIRTTMFQEKIPSLILNVVSFAALFVFLIRFLCPLKDEKGEARLLQIGALCLLVPPVFTAGTRAPLYFALLAFSARGIDLDRIMKRYIAISAVCFLATILAANFGLIVNVATERDRGTYYAWGFYYLTELSAHLTSLCLAAIYVLRNRLRFWHAAVVLAAGGLTYLLANSRLSLVMFVLAAIAVVLLASKHADTIFGARFIPWLPVIFALGALALAAAYSPDSSLMVKLDDLLTNRLRFSSKGLWDYGITLFGQHVTMQGWGGSQKVWGDHIFYLDCSYINILLRSGAIPLATVLWLFVRNIQHAQYREDSVLVACLSLIAVSSLINEHLADVAYDPFLFALLAAAPAQAVHLDEEGWFAALPEMRLCHKVCRKVGRALNERHANDIAPDSRAKKHLGGPVLSGPGGECLFDPCVVKSGERCRMYVSRRSDGAIVAYDSEDGVDWTFAGVCLEGRPASWDAAVNRCCVIRRGRRWVMWYTGQSNGTSAIGCAMSADGLHFRRLAKSPVLTPERSREGISAMNPTVLSTRDGGYLMFYAAGEDYEPDAIWSAQSEDGIHWTKLLDGPALAADPDIPFQSYKVGGPEVHRTADGGMALLYIGYQNLDVARVCIAYSADGRHWTKAERPLIVPGPDAWDASAAYKPTAIRIADGTAIWYNGRHASKESIGLAVYDGNLFRSSGRGRHMARPKQLAAKTQE